jgi:hypothetical protein
MGIFQPFGPETVVNAPMLSVAKQAPSRRAAETDKMFVVAEGTH